MRLVCEPQVCAYFDDAEFAAFSVVDLHRDAATLFEGKKNWVGPVGEDVFEAWVNYHAVPYERVSRAERFAKKDFRLWPGASRTITLDVKTLAVQFAPFPHYVCNVAEQHLSHDVDGYVFGRYVLPENRLILVGWLTKRKFMERAVRKRQGDVDSSNGFVSPIDHRQIEIRQLEPLETLLHGSSEVERPPVKRDVAGSTPARAAIDYDEKEEFDIHVDAALRSMRRIAWTRPPSNQDHHIEKDLAAKRDCSLGVCAKCNGPIIERVHFERGKELACHYCGRKPT